MIRRLRRAHAELALDRLDAEVARWLVYYGSLSETPLDHPPLRDAAETGTGSERWGLRARRLAAVQRLERLGGRDPWPAVLQPPTDAQRAAYARPETLRRALRELYDAHQAVIGVRDLSGAQVDQLEAAHEQARDGARYNPRAARRPPPDLRARLRGRDVP